MSEHQVYDFVAVDRPLTAKQMTELRAISTRAEISSTRFWNEYHWGDLKADSWKLLAKYFDVLLYSASWGERRFMVRLPADRVDVKGLRRYLGGQPDALTKVGDSYILALSTSGDDWEPDDEDCPELTDPVGLVSLRVGLLHGDMRVPYLGWLLAVQGEDVADAAREPALPAGLWPLSGPLAALADILRIDPDLLEAAGEASSGEHGDPEALRRFISGMSVKDKDRWLCRAVEQPERPIGPELAAEFRKLVNPDAAGRRTAGQLRARAEALREAAEREAKAETAREEAKRRAGLAKPWRAQERSWAKIEEQVAEQAYEEAVTLALELHEAAAQAGQTAEFMAGLAALKQRQPSRRGFFTRMNRRLAPRATSGPRGELRL